jgi:hypothetical protein
MFPEYREQLRSVFFEDIAKQKLDWPLSELLYTEESMHSFLRRLFPSEKQTVIRKKAEAGWLISAGTSYNKIDVNGDKTVIEVGQNYKSYFSPLVSIAYMRSFNRNLGKYFFYPQLRFYRYKNDVETRNSNIRTTIEFSTSLAIAADIHVGVNLINREKMRLLLSAGAGQLRMINNKHVRNRYENTNTTPYFTTEDKLSGSAFIANASGGLMLNGKLLLMVTYQIPAQIGALGRYEVVGSSMQLRIGYYLN